MDCSRWNEILGMFLPQSSKHSHVIENEINKGLTESSDEFPLSRNPKPRAESPMKSESAPDSCVVTFLQKEM